MRRCAFLFHLLVLIPALLMGQLTFPELVDRAFGSDQLLVNGIQFSNQYIRVEGDPYWMDGQFRTGSVCINDLWYKHVRLRYNLYSRRVEIEYFTPEGHLNQLMSVAEQMPAFIIEGYEFRRMQIGEEAPAYYQVLSTGTSTCYVGWTMELLGGGSYDSQFGPPQREYWIEHGSQWMTFNDRKTYVRAFPPLRKKELKKLLKNRKFSFIQAINREMVELIAATISLYEAGGGQ